MPSTSRHSRAAPVTSGSRLINRWRLTCSREPPGSPHLSKLFIPMQNKKRGCQNRSPFQMCFPLEASRCQLAVVANHHRRPSPTSVLSRGLFALTFLVLLLLLLLLLRHAPSIDFERIAPTVALLFGESVARRFDPPTDKTSYEYAVPPLHRRWLVGS